MIKLAQTAGKSALVIKECTINDNGPLYVRIVGRKAGIIGWFLATLGIDASTTLEVYQDRIEFSEGSLAGHLKEMIPLTSVSNLGTGYLKPIGWIIAMLVVLIASLNIAAAGHSTGPIAFAVTFSIICIICYLLQKTMLIYVIPNSSLGAIVKFKRSIIAPRQFRQHSR